MDLTVLTDYGIDYEKGLARCFDNRALYEKVLRLFLEDDSLTLARKAHENRDYATLHSCMHTLKGSSGNADMTDLYQAVYPLVTHLRLNSASEEEIAQMFSRVEAAYERAREGILLAIEDKPA